MPSAGRGGLGTQGSRRVEADGVARRNECELADTVVGEWRENCRVLGENGKSRAIHFCREELKQSETGQLDECKYRLVFHEHYLC